ncbi:MAG: hypothetical protein HYS89_02225 [Candidatus Colwellbacteria bacterium]|nr:hypothetical protein [Candidatus Colwellbacteria bacterium]
MAKDRLIIFFFLTSFIFIAIASLVGYIGLPQDPGGPLIIKLNRLSDEIDLAGGVGTFFGVLGIALTMYLINFFLAWQIYHRDRFFSYIIGVGTLVVSLLFLIVAGVIATLN